MLQFGSVEKVLDLAKLLDIRIELKGGFSTTVEYEWVSDFVVGSN